MKLSEQLYTVKLPGLILSSSRQFNQPFPPTTAQRAPSLRPAPNPHAQNPDFIILDEFHRCGAELWGKGVDAVLREYSTTPVLGLSATAIRYLDNQRNMTDELFDGNIASEMAVNSITEYIKRSFSPDINYSQDNSNYQKNNKKHRKYNVK